MFFLDNVDPDRTLGLLDILDLKTTLVNVVSKCGGTAETIANYLVVRERMLEALGDGYRDNVVLSTSNQGGELKSIAADEGIRLLPLPDKLGGRYSVISPCGLLCPAFLGLDVTKFIDGALAMDHRLQETDVWKNPAYLYSAAHFLADTVKGLDIFAMMPYSSALKTIADWYAQLYAESLGKITPDGRMVGPTPVKTLGATDQHSQLQLYAQGTVNKVVTFLAVDEFSGEAPIPKAYPRNPSMEYLGGHSLAELLNAERQATAHSLARNKRLNCTVHLPRITPFTLGQLFYFFEYSVIHMGALYGVNPIDQPGVEESKNYARGLMGREGYENLREEVEQAAKSDRIRL